MEFLRNPCILGGPQSKGDKIRIGCLTRALAGAQKRAEVLRNSCHPRGPRCQRTGRKSELAAAPQLSRGTPTKRGQNEKWLPHPCLLTAGVPLVVVQPGRQGEKQVARLSDTAVPRAGQAALEEHRAVTSSRGGRENSARHKHFRGGTGPTSCLLAMKRHGPFSSPGHVRDHEPFFIHWDRAIPQPGYPQP